MKIGIIGDVHFGAGFNLGKTDPDTQLNSRLIDFSNTFNNIIDEMEKYQVKLVVLTGDIFDSKNPTSSQLSVFSKCITRASNKGMRFLVVVGNHDQQRAISSTSVDVFKALNLENIIIHSDFDVYSFSEQDKNINIITMPYRDKKMFEGAQTNENACDAIKEILKEKTKDLQGLKICIGHFMIDKPISGTDIESFSMTELVLPLEIFDDMNAVIMGHVHKHEIFKKNPLITYVGSMEKISFGEKSHQKISIILDTDNINKYNILKTNTRNLFEIDLDYTSGDKYYKNQINDQIFKDIDCFSDQNNLEDSIIKLLIKVKDNDLYFINQEKIKEHILSKKINHLVQPQITATNTRKLRNKQITETIDEKKAIEAFINNLEEPETLKKKLLKSAIDIIKETER